MLAAQTTQDRSEFTEITRLLSERRDLDVDVLDTICDATRLRQREAKEIADAAQAMVVVGGRMSGNTRRLVQVCASLGKPCFHVETPDELPLDELRGLEVVGLTAGASTPADLIESVLAVLQEL